MYALEHAIELVTVGRGECFLYYPPPPGNGTDILHGLIVFDHAGHLIDAFGPMGDQKQQLLASVAEERWPCYADETLGYTCKGLGH